MVKDKINKRIPRVLVLSVSAWQDTNSFGNTLTNLFNNYPKDRIAHIYCRTELPRNNVCDKYFRFSEADVIKNIFFKRNKIGEILDIKYIVSNHADGNKEIAREIKLYNTFRRNRYFILLLFRELLWKIAKWNRIKLNLFLKEFKPEILFIKFPTVHYIFNIFKYIKKTTNAKIIVYADDDDYTLKQFSLSPFYWINRLALRRKVRYVVNVAKGIYCFSYKQKNEYDKLFNINCRLIYKSSDFNSFDHKKSVVNRPVKMVYAGNIIYGRWKSLARIGRALKNINADGIKAQLDIYTQNAMSERMRKALEVKGSVFMKGGVSFSKVKEVLMGADIVVHVESYELKSRLLTRLSFSTKLVDYFESGRCIFALGWKDAASIDYLMKNDAAVVATRKADIETKLREMIENPQLILDYGQKAWNCGQRNHRSAEIKGRFWADLEALGEN